MVGSLSTVQEGREARRGGGEPRAAGSGAAWATRVLSLQRSVLGRGQGDARHEGTGEDALVTGARVLDLQGGKAHQLRYINACYAGRFTELRGVGVLALSMFWREAVCPPPPHGNAPSRGGE